MKKTLLSLACAAMVSSAAVAQVNEMYSGHYFTAFSPDGKILAENLNMGFTVINRNNGMVYDLTDADGMVMYSLGMGKSVTNDGTVVGSCDNDAMIFSNGKVTALPQLTGLESGLNIANAITADKKYITGMLGFDGSSFGSDGMMGYPVIWTRQADGSYLCEALPYPTKDFAGEVPQYVSGIDISDDGSVILAHIVDGRGMLHMPLLYQKNADGAWSYAELAPELSYDKDKIANLPEKAGDSPERPDVEDYMSEQDKANYAAAYEQYQEELQAYYQGLIEDRPTYPEQENYISDAAQKAAYAAAQEKYAADYKAWSDAFQAYDDAFYGAMTGATWLQNSEKVSRNGRFVAADIQVEDPEGSMGWFASYFTSPVRFDLSQETLVADKTEATDEASTSILDDGSLVTASPAMAYSRNSFFYALGDTKGQPFAEYLATRNEDAAKFMKDNFTFDVTNITYDEDYNPITTIVEDSLITGTIFANADGTIFLANLEDSYSDEMSYTYLSCIYDLNEGAVTAIEGVNRENESAVLRREFYNLQGQRIAEPAQGVYLEKVFTSEGSYAVKRIK